MSVGPKWMVVLAVCVVMAAVVTWDVGGKCTSSPSCPSGTSPTTST